MGSDSILRLFVAVYPPVEVAEALLGLVRAQRDLPKYRLVPVGQVHLTLQFIGDTEVRELEEVIESVRRSAAGLEGFELAPERLITLPERGPARLIAAQTSAPAALLELQRRLAHRLAKNPRERAGDRFRPHLTLCRFATPAQVQLDEAVGVPGFGVERVRLMKSVLKPSGAEHVEVVGVELE